MPPPVYPTWSFDTGSPPFLEAEFPPPDSVVMDVNTLIAVDIIDAESYVDLSTLDAYVDGYDAYRATGSGPWGFISPYDGPLSAIVPIPPGEIDGYDGYELVLDRTTVFPWADAFTVRVKADDYGGNELDDSWSFTTPANVAVSIDEAGGGANPAYDIRSFISPYDEGSTVVYNDSDGYEGYNFVIQKEGRLADGIIITDVTIDGYENNLYDRSPAPGAIDRSRYSEIRFRIRKIT